MNALISRFALPTGIPCGTDAAYRSAWSRMVAFWSAVSSAFAQRMDRLGPAVDWNSVTYENNAPTSVISSTGSVGAVAHPTGLSEVFVATPFPSDPSKKLYIKLIYQIGAYRSSASVPLGCTPGIIYSLSVDGVNFNSNRRMSTGYYAQNGSSSTQNLDATYTLITSEVGFAESKSGVATTSGFVHGVSAWPLGDPMTGLNAERMILSLHLLANYTHITAPLAEFPISTSSGVMTGQCVMDFINQVERAIAYPVWGGNEMVTDLTGQNAIIAGPYYVAAGRLYAQHYPGCPVFYMPKVAGLEGAEQVVGPHSYRCVGALAYDAATSLPTSYPWFRTN